MLDLGRVEEVRSLLANGLSQRATSRQSGVSRGTVAAIYHGRWAPRLGRRHEAMSDGDLGPLPNPKQAAAIKARAREAAARKSPESIRRLFAQHGPPELDLRPDEQAEYIRVRQRQGRWPPAEENEEDASEQIDPRAA